MIDLGEASKNRSPREKRKGGHEIAKETIPESFLELQTMNS